MVSLIMAAVTGCPIGRRPSLCSKVGDSKSVLSNLLQSAVATWRRREPLRWQYRKAATEVPQSLTGSDSNSGNYCASSVQYNCNLEFYAAEVSGQFRKW